MTQHIADEPGIRVHAKILIPFAVLFTKSSNNATDGAQNPNVFGRNGRSAEDETRRGY